MDDSADDIAAYLELLLISNMRLYDVMLNIFSEMTSEHKANVLRTQHMENQLFYPPVMGQSGSDEVST